MKGEYEGMGLSPEELAALDEKVETPSAGTPPVELPPDDPPKAKDLPIKDDDDDDDDDAGDGDGEGDTPPADPPKADDPPADPPKADEDGYEKLEFQDFLPYEVRHVPDFDVKIAEVDKQRGELVAKFKDGELTLEEFLVEDRKVQAEETKLRDDEREAATLEKINEQNASRAWFGNVKSFIAEVKKVEGINYDNATLNAALDNAVKTLANDKANIDKSQAWFLREAHRVVKADLGIARQAVPAPAIPAAPAKPASRQPDLKAVPTTLTKVPAAAPNDPKGSDEFANLDQLDGMELEAAIAKLSPDQQARYLHG